MQDPMNVDRLRDIYRVHDTTKKSKKEKRRTDDDREFRDFLEETEKEPEGYMDFAEERDEPDVPSDKMLNMLGASPIPHFKIEPIDAPDEPAVKNGKPATAGDAESGKNGDE